MAEYNKIIYTCDIGNYDRVAPISNNHRSKCKAILFTDKRKNHPKGWSIHLINKDDFPDLPNVAIAKLIKINPQIFLPTHRWNFWLDGNKEFIRPFKDFFDHYKDYDFVSTLHDKRKYDDLYNEIDSCKTHGRKYINEDLLEKQKQGYLEQGIPNNCNNRICSSIILRKNNDLNSYLSMIWTADFLRWKTWRDQLSFRAVTCNNNFEINLIKYRDIITKLENYKNDKDKYKEFFFAHKGHKK